MPADKSANQENRIKVFISYSHDSQSHKDGVLKLAERLMGLGIDVILDAWINGSPEQGWPLWMAQSLKQADFVLVVCSKNYYQRAMGEAPDGLGQGVKWESLLFNGHIYTNDSRNKKFIAVFLDNADIEIIPDGLRSFTYYSLDDDEQFKNLYRYLTNQPEHVKPDIGEVLELGSNNSKDTNFQPTKPAKSTTNTNQKVNLAAMPTSSGKIVGRETEVAWLNQAWDDAEQSVVSIIGLGGEGKSSLINHWLKAMRAGKFKGAMRVFAHSFYSQGTSDQRNVSAEHFMADAFRFLNYVEANIKKVPQSSHEKGLLLAELFCQQRTLLVLDGLEPMQHPPGVLKGKLKDSTLEVFIKQLAFNLDGLCVITSRVPVYELANRGEQYQLQSLSVEAGIEVLTNFGVTGPKQDMENAVEEVHGHALTLSLLGGYLSAACEGDIRKRDTIPNLVDEPNEGEHAKHVMHSYQVWLEQTERFEDVNILFVIALFDRPVEMTTVNALLAGDAIAGVTDKLKSLPAAKLKFAIGRLVKLQLISDENNILDCHPLVREHFANTLKAQNPLGYQQAHQRLYEYYKNLPEDELPSTLELMQPLFNAISHGCKAGLYRQALDEVYVPRILRKEEVFINNKLGAFATDLTCIANFFTDDVWAQPANDLTMDDQAVMLNWAAFALRGLGRLYEALAPFIAGFELQKGMKDWQNAARAAASASELCLTLGQVGKAIEYGKFCVEYADQIEKGNEDEFLQMALRTTYADALLQRGKQNDITQAQALFIEAEKRQQAWQPSYPYLYSVQGYRYCQLLLKHALSAQSVNKVIERAETIVSWRQEGDSILDIALEDLTLGKAYLRINDLTQAQHYLDQAVSGLRKAGQFDYLLKGLLTRASYYTQSNTDKSNTPNHQAAWRDLDETFEIASFGDMRLHLCDYHIEACRNIAVQLAGNGKNEFIVIENGQTIYPSKAQMVERMNEHFETAKTMIDELSYHWRDDDLGDVQEALMP